MRKQTKLMSKLLGSKANQEFKDKIFSKIDEAREKGYSTLDEDGELLQFAEVDDDIIVEDQANGNELTRVSENPDNENDLVLTEVEKAPTEETKAESANLESIEIERIPGVDGEKAEDIVPDYQVEIVPGIGTENETPIEATYSMKFKNYSKSKANRIAKLFSACVGCLEGVVKDADVDEDVDVKVSDKGEVKVMSVHYGRNVKTFSEPELSENADLTEVIDKVNELAEKVDAGLTKENAEEVKAECDKLMSELTEAEESKGIKLYSFKSLIKRFSEENAEFMDKEGEPKDPEIPAEPNKSEEQPAEPSEETKTESAKVSQCPETGKWCVEGSEEKYDTEEEAQEAAKNFSATEENEPKVTVTIENIEPASVSSLLAGPSGDEGKDKDEERESTEPKVDPNFGEQGRQFSLNNGEKYENPLLHTRW